MGWELKPYVAVTPDPTKPRGQVACLTALGLEAHNRYPEIASEVERWWETQYGSAEVGALRENLEELLTMTLGGHPVLAEGLAPIAGTIRSGTQAPAHGRRDVGPAARQRARDMAAQSRHFVADPLGSLPHYPLWDMNRGFGP